MSHNNLEWVIYPGIITKDGIFHCPSIVQLTVIRRYVHFFALYNDIYIQCA